MNPKFDQHPAIQKILAETKDRPGAFGAAMENLATPLVEELRRNQPKASTTGGTHG
ncbi:hypothetical protein [Cupriavidus malaysiensis]|nr:hypothetical protein [Cupriavidus malaysiensis]